MAIRSFRDKALKVFFETGKSGKRCQWRNIKKIAQRKLDMLHYAAQLSDLKSPPANHLEAPEADLRGYYSVRINDQWRLVFRWAALGPEDVSIVDYH